MNRFFKQLVLLPFIAVCFLSLSPKKPPRVLVFSKTAGYHHASITAGMEAVKNLSLQNGFAVDTTTDSTAFTYKNLKQYSAVLFLSTSGNVLGANEQEAFQKYIRKGGGFIGVHSATDTEYDWPWYGELVGGYFASHPNQQQAMLRKTDSTHPATKALPAAWSRYDEWYNFKNLNPAAQVVLTIDETSYTGGKNGAGHPMAWWRNLSGGGRMFYTALGHTDASYGEPLFLQHLTGGILFVLGKK